jgi:uncharacterized protein GlcG (DUF336 family)
MTEKELYEIVNQTIVGLSKGNVKKDKLDLTLAMDIAKACIQKAQEINLKATIAICDQHGNAILFYRMEESLLVSSDIAPKKAYTSVALNMSTAEAKIFMDKHANHLDNATEGRLVFFAGGLPIRIDGKLVGGLGVSGGLPEQDQEIASHGLKTVALSE